LPPNDEQAVAQPCEQKRHTARKRYAFEDDESSSIANGAYVDLSKTAAIAPKAIKKAHDYVT